MTQHQREATRADCRPQARERWSAVMCELVGHRVHVRVHTRHVLAHKHACTCLYAPHTHSTRIHAHIGAHTYTYALPHTHTQGTYTFARIHSLVFLHTHTHPRTCTQMHANPSACTQMHTTCSHRQSALHVRGFRIVDCRSIVFMKKKNPRRFQKAKLGFAVCRAVAESTRVRGVWAGAAVAHPQTWAVRGPHAGPRAGSGLPGFRVGRGPGANLRGCRGRGCTSECTRAHTHGTCARAGMCTHMPTRPPAPPGWRPGGRGLWAASPRSWTVLPPGLDGAPASAPAPDAPRVSSLSVFFGSFVVSPRASDILSVPRFTPPLSEPALGRPAADADPSAHLSVCPPGQLQPAGAPPPCGRDFISTPHLPL